ncbi:hypothetical protein MKW92_051570 [Papaver armeniacum]|nr:hypothetical protein MKW92_051570 [Papaver armeniacum]
MVGRSIKWVFFSVMCLVVMINHHSAQAEDGLITKNGDFETPPTNGFSNEGVVDGTEYIPEWKTSGTVELVESGQKQGGMILIVPQEGSLYSITFSAARTCAQLESLNISVPPASQSIDLQTLYNVQGWDFYSVAFQADSDDSHVVFQNPGMEDDPTCGPIIDDIAIKKLFTPDKPKGKNTSLGVLLPTHLDEETTTLPGWIIESNRAVRYIDSYHFDVPQGKRAIELLSGKEGIISQMVETKPDKKYSLTFAIGHAGDSCQQQPLAIMAFAGDQVANIHYMPGANKTFDTANVTFTAKAERSRIAFYSVYYNQRSDDKSSLCGPVVDDVKVWTFLNLAHQNFIRQVESFGRLCFCLFYQFCLLRYPS